MASRTGLPTMLRIARELCRLITKFTPVIEVAFPGNTALLAALAAANAACATLHSEIVAVTVLGD